MKKRRSEFPHSAFSTGCRSLRQEPFEILALALPCGQGNFPMPGGSSVSSTSFLQTALAEQPSASRCRGTIRRTTSPPFGNTSPTTELLGIGQPTRGEKQKSRGGLLWIETT